MKALSIRTHQLGKRYQIGEKVKYFALRDNLAQFFLYPWRALKGCFSPNGTEDQPGNFIWALKEVSFEVPQGEVVGIIGRNGAGKSTLLKILSRITEPTEGWAEIHGRVGSLLEVGTGFHPELTGRENLYLNGAILGMRKAEIDRKFDEIVAFAEIERFIDTPVKYYSSGMYVRLAFAVAAHLEPEILLVDEVLAVGDASFQKKCLGKMGEVAKAGRTVLFVSHNMGAITRLCKRALWLDQGRIVQDGPASEVVSRYQAQYLTACPEWQRPPQEEIKSPFALLKIQVKNEEGQVAGVFGGNEAIRLELHYLIRQPLVGCAVGIRVHNSDGIPVFTSVDSDQEGVSALPKEPGYYQAILTIPGYFLAPGTYYVSAGAHLPFRTLYEFFEQVVVFEVSPSGSLASLDGRWGIVTPLIPWETFRKPLEK